VRIATPGVTTAEETVANLLAAAPAAAELVGGWDNVLSVGIKTSTSVLLPVWNAPLAGRFKDAESEEMEVEEEPKPKAKATKATEAKEKKAAPALKKSSTVGSGAKKAKASAVGAAKPKTKAKAK
jgi:ribosome biogenesis protein UTP30